MDNVEIILNCLREHGSMTITKISAKTGLSNAAVRYSVTSLYEQHVLSRNKNYTYSLTPYERPSENAGYLEAVKTATELQARGLWQRASHNWLRAMVLAKFDDNRQNAKVSRDKCMSRAKMRCGHYGGIASGKVSDAGLWELNR